MRVIHCDCRNRPCPPSARCEESLNTNLFHRHARGLILTEQGELLFDATQSMVKRLEAAEARIKDSEEEVFGELRVTTSTGFGSLWLAPRLPKLYEKYPELKIDLMLEERVLDLPMREADVAIRMKEPSQADLIRKRLMSVKMRLYASPSYIKTHGVPEKLEDMVNHRLICQHPRSAQVSAGLALTQHLMTYDLPSMLTVNNYFGVLQAVIHDLGIEFCQITSHWILMALCGFWMNLSRSRSPFIWPIQKSCVIPNGLRPFATLCRAKLLIIVARSEMANYPNKHKPCIFCIAGMLHLRHSFS